MVHGSWQPQQHAGVADMRVRTIAGDDHLSSGKESYNMVNEVEEGRTLAC